LYTGADGPSAEAERALGSLGCNRSIGQQAATGPMAA
jgi:hypothetical protein